MILFHRIALASTLMLSLASLAACGDDGAGPQNEGEVITTVLLELTQAGGSTTNTFTWNDADGDGGNPPTIDTVQLLDGTSYAAVVRFQNRLEDPPEEITDEVRDEADAHQVFFTGSAIIGPASNVPAAPVTHAYDDTDANGLPIGLRNTLTARGGSGELTLTLRHMPPVNGTPVKTADTAAAVREGGFSAIGGATDVQVTFSLAVAVP